MGDEISVRNFFVFWKRAFVFLFQPTRINNVDYNGDLQAFYIYVYCSLELTVTKWPIDANIKHVRTAIITLTTTEQPYYDASNCVYYVIRIDFTETCRVSLSRVRNLCMSVLYFCWKVICQNRSTFKVSF